MQAGREGGVGARTAHMAVASLAHVDTAACADRATKQTTDRDSNKILGTAHRGYVGGAVGKKKGEGPHVGACTCAADAAVLRASGGQRRRRIRGEAARDVVPSGRHVRVGRAGHMKVSEMGQVGPV